MDYHGTGRVAGTGMHGDSQTGGTTRSHLVTHRNAHTGRRQRPKHGRFHDQAWEKALRRSTHMLRTPPAWALDMGDLSLAEEAGVTLVAIQDMETRSWYWATLNTVRRHGFLLERGHGKQVALPIKWWAATRGDAEISDVFTEEEEHPEPVQLPLLGAGL